MKKIIKYLCYLVFVIVVVCSLNLRTHASSICINKIFFYNNQSYEEFISNTNNNQNINVLIRVLDNSESCKDLLNNYLDNKVDDYYISEFVPYGMINYKYEEDFINDYEFILKLANTPYIEYIFIDYENVVENNDFSSDLMDDSLAQSWDDVCDTIETSDYNSIINENIKIGILEAGGVPDKNNSFLLNNIDNMIIYNENNPNVQVNDHATVVASIITDITKRIDNVELYCAKVADNNILKILDWFCKQNVSIINLSWGIDERITLVYGKYDALYDYYAREFGILFIKSAGNRGKTNSYITPPGRGYNIITVGSIDKYKNVIDISSTIAPNNKPDLVAPGMKIVDMPLGVSYIDEDNNGNALNSNTGTSFSTPIVTGIAALLKAQFPDMFKCVESIVNILVSAAQKINKEDSTWINESGYGIVNYKNCLDIINENRIINNFSNEQETIYELKQNYGVEIFANTLVIPTIDESNQNVDNYQVPETVFIPKIKIQLINISNGQIVTESSVTNSNINNLKFINFTNEPIFYNIKIISLDNAICQYSVSIRNYGEYEKIDENYSYHIWESSLDLIKENHILDYSEEKVFCQKCNFSQDMDEIIITDPDQWTLCGSEVNLKEADFRGNEITQGFTRMLYFDSNIAPSISRLDYNWNSSDDSVATVSIYGTVTAQIVEKPTWITITASYKYNSNIVFYKKLYIIPEIGDEYIIIYKQVTMGVDESYSLVLTDEEYPTTRIQNYHWNVPCQADESAGVRISVWGTITASAPGIMYIEGWYELNQYVAIYIEVIVT